MVQQAFNMTCILNTSAKQAIHAWLAVAHESSPTDRPYADAILSIYQ